MKKALCLICGIFLFLTSCTTQSYEREVRIVVSNSNAYDLDSVVQGVSLSAVLDSLRTQDHNMLTLFDEQGRQVCTQLFDNGVQQLLLFECSVLAQGESSYTLRQEAPLAEDKLAISAEISRGMALRRQLDELRQTIATARWDTVPMLQHQADSLTRLLDVSLLGGYAYPSTDALPRIPAYSSTGSQSRNPWQYRKLDILSEGPLMCAYQLTYDTLYIQSDTLIEHRTLAMQRGTDLTIVRHLLENAGHLDTLLQCSQLYAGLPCYSSDSLIVDESLSYLAIQHSDSTTTGIFAPQQTGSMRSIENRLAAFLLPMQPDSLLTYYTLRPSSAPSPLSLSKAQQELQRMHDAPLSVRLSVQQR